MAAVLTVNRELLVFCCLKNSADFDTLKYIHVWARTFKNILSLSFLKMISLLEIYKKVDQPTELAIQLNQ